MIVAQNKPIVTWKKSSYILKPYFAKKQECLSQDILCHLIRQHNYKSKCKMISITNKTECYNFISF